MKQNKQIFKSAPLPFQGQKRNFVKEFQTALTELNPTGEITTIVDLFGGSGLLSHTAKRYMPQCRVVFNDFDDFHLRLEHVSTTNAILAELRAILADCPRHERITGERRQRIEAVLKRADAAGFVDWVTLSGSLLFSCKYQTSLDGFLKESFYNNVKQEDYHADDYLDGIEVVKCDYRELAGRFQGRRDVLFLVDPPYLSTDAASYKAGAYWKLKDYLDVLLTLLDGNYIYFTSSKSQIVELCDWFAAHFGINTPFSNAAVKTYQVKGKVLNYTDMMFYKPFAR
ncbi:MAG: DNA adenine methylase [Alistipes sp.]|jgi:16S rRNA G966 N2-methylase RsmD|nr:DNA adenine methylase [Alistipes sp.]